MKKSTFLACFLLFGCVSQNKQEKTYSNTEVRIMFANDIKGECIDGKGSNNFCECAALHMTINTPVKEQVEYLNARRAGHQEDVDKAMSVEQAKKVSAFCHKKIKSGEDFYVIEKLD